MTIQLKIGLEQLQQALPGLSSKTGEWAGSLKSNEVPYDPVQQDIEVKPLQQQYTSLRDLIMESPTKRGSVKGHEVEWCDVTELKFKDNLLKLAARAYLQPMYKESTPEAHFLLQCWMTFAARNRALIADIVESVQKQADACVKFLRSQAVTLMQWFMPKQHVGSLAANLN
ncbi:hypothetical protein KP509_25G071200 [Ceratopteris richardii]|uniref:Uncharacterized protein n=1 Tax=Ceratopteris richardii TaxID=49495 RepID=A0A8T2RRK7_CERRI|nr:hypothetical protein KP509_25G071200 [Ceratopteris richardii]KAH7299062.1 hypothetical protein KP509_25G071200 [Ceratopteris richardii]